MAKTNKPKINCELCEKKMSEYEVTVERMNNSGVLLTAVCMELMAAIKEGKKFEDLSQQARDIVGFIDKANAISSSVYNLVRLGELNEEEAADELLSRVQDTMKKEDES